MNLTLTFKHIEHTPALDEKIREKAEKLEKYLESNMNVKWTCSVDGELQTSEVEITGHKGAPFFASSTSDNLYKTFDDVVQKVSRQIKKKSTREGRKHQNHKQTDILHSA
jgi:putative sigma-54 modulation protein